MDTSCQHGDCPQHVLSVPRNHEGWNDWWLNPEDSELKVDLHRSVFGSSGDTWSTERIKSELELNDLVLRQNQTFNKSWRSA